MADAYAGFAVEFEADLSRVQAGMQQGLSWSRLYGGEMARGFASEFANVSGAVDMLQGIKGRFASTAQGLSEIFGMKAAADIGYYRRQLIGLVGDASKAEQMLSQITQIANTTSFANSDIFAMVNGIIGTGSSPDQAMGETAAILDAVASSGTRDMATFRRFARNLTDLRLSPGEPEKQQVMQSLRAAPLIGKQAADTLGVSQPEAMNRMMSMSGEELYQLFVQIGQRNKGRAAAEGMADPFQAAANAVDQFNTAMAPTGEMLNRLLTPIVALGGGALQTFGKFNALAHGLPGLILGVGIITGAYRLHTATIGRATLALNALAASAGRAAATGAVPPVIGGMGAAGGLRGILARLGGPALIGAIAYSAVDATSNWMSEQGGLAGRFGAAGQAGLHQMTNLAGGGWWMSPVKAFQAFQSYKDPQQVGGTMEQAAKDLKVAASDLKDAAADGYGYGKRGKATMSSIEAGYALLGAERLGIA